MPLDYKLQKFPICDTDLWIKACKISHVDFIFDNFQRNILNLRSQNFLYLHI
jgi:hypothetical protein